MHFFRLPCLIARAATPVAAAILAVPISACGGDSDDASGSSASSSSPPGSTSSSGSGVGGSGGTATGSGATGGASSGTGGHGGTPDPGVPYVYVGLGNGSIASFLLDRATGELTAQGETQAGNYPSFLATDPSKHYLYAAIEGSSQVASFRIDPSSGALTKLNSVDSQGNGPAHVAVDGTGSWVMVANYGGGTAAVIAVQADGSLGDAVDVESPGTNPHLILTDPTNAYAFVPNKGSDKVSQFVFDASSGALSPNTPASVATAPGAGPRHLAFHPTAPFVYVINENDDTVVAYEAGATPGTLAPIQTISTLPGGFNGNNNTCAEVTVSKDGRYLYGSNRGHDSIVIFAIDAQRGTLTLVDHQPTGGSTPRNFGIDPDGGILLAANQDSNNVVSFRIDPDSGKLTELVTTPVNAKPYWVGVVPQPTP